MGPANKGDSKDNGVLGGEERGRSPSGAEPNTGGLHEGPPLTAERPGSKSWF